MTQLVLDNNRIGQVGAKLLADGIRDNETMTDLRIANCQIAEEGAITIAAVLHNKKNLMTELSKVRRVMEKVVPDAPHEVLLVLDGSTGQNALLQAKAFSEATKITSLAVTKLDGTAKGGVVIGISDQLSIPVKFIGVGEGMEDLQLFNPEAFASSLFKK